MTTLQKAITGAVLVTVAAIGIHQMRRVSLLQSEVQTLRRQGESLAAHLAQISSERDMTVSQIATLRQENERLQQAAADVPKLRGELARLQAAEKLSQSGNGSTQLNDPFSQSVLALTTRAAELNQHRLRMPDKSIPELRFLNEHQWLDAARDADLQSDIGVRKALSKLRSLAKASVAGILSPALDAYIEANQGELPTELSQLKPYLKVPLEDSILDRYELLRTGKVSDLPPDAWVISEKRPVDRDYDSHWYIGPRGRSGSWGTGLGSTGDPDPTWAAR